MQHGEVNPRGNTGVQNQSVLPDGAVDKMEGLSHTSHVHIHQYKQCAEGKLGWGGVKPSFAEARKCFIGK